MSERHSTVPNVAVVLNRDLLFGSRVRGALKELALEARFVGTTDQFVAELETHQASGAIGIIDMNGGVTWETLKDGLLRIDNAPPTLAFGPHTDVANRRAAKAAGVTRIVSNGQFHKDMQNLIDRYRRHS